MSSGKLVLIRHGESQWNALSKWTGWTDVSLSEKGYDDALKIGESLKDLHFDVIYTSNLKRSIETMQAIAKTQGQTNYPFERVKAINERDYGDYTGLNKWEVKEKFGEEKFNAIRRNFDEPIPGGETLHDVYDRAVPWYKESVVPKLVEGKNVLIVAHGNSIRALVKYIEGLSDDEIAKFEMVFGKVLIYTIDIDGREKTKEVREVDLTPTNA